MTNINIYLRDNLGAVSRKNISTAPNIEEKKLNNAVKAFGYSGSPSKIVALFDNTLFGSGKDGLVFTGEQFIYRPSFSDPIPVSYDSIAKVEHVETWTGSNKDKIEHSVEVVRHDESKVVIKDLLECDYAKLARLCRQLLMILMSTKKKNSLSQLTRWMSR